MDYGAVIECVEAYLEPERCPACESDDTEYHMTIDAHKCHHCGIEWIILMADAS